MTYTLPSSPKDRQRIKDAIIEASNQLLLIEGARETINTTRKDLKTDLELPPALFNEMLQAYHRQTYGEKVAKQEAFQEVYSVLFDVE